MAESIPTSKTLVKAYRVGLGGYSFVYSGSSGLGVLGASSGSTTSASRSTNTNTPNAKGVSSDTSTDFRIF